MRAVADIAAAAGVSRGLAVVASPDRLALIRPMPSSGAASLGLSDPDHYARGLGVSPLVRQSLGFGTANIHPADLPPAQWEREKAQEAAHAKWYATAPRRRPIDRRMPNF
jgi:hypothetical protein